MNQVGTVSEKSLKLPHGSLCGMSTDSQKIWKHEIRSDPSVGDPRISFTFRKLVDTSELLTRSKAPPIHRPDPRVHSSNRATHKRILFITDSILSSVSDTDFHAISGYRCVQQSNAELTKIFEYEDEFQISDFVIVSGGINDLSCYDHSTETLFNFIKPKILSCCKRANNTTFVFNSLVYTRYKWLNREVDVFNKMLFELSCEIENMKFFDSLDILKNSSLARDIDNILPPGDRRGVHVSRRAIDLVRKSLVTAIELLDSRWSDSPVPANLRGWRWPLACYQVSGIRRLQSQMGPDFCGHPEYRRSPMYA